MMTFAGGQSTAVLSSAIMAFWRCMVSSGFRIGFRVQTEASESHDRELKPKAKHAA
jgi:hypothetical protein